MTGVRLLFLIIMGGVFLTSRTGRTREQENIYLIGDLAQRRRGRGEFWIENRRTGGAICGLFYHALIGSFKYYS